MENIESKTLDYIAGMGSSRGITGTTAVTGSFQGFIVNKTAVIAEVLDQNGNDITAFLGCGGGTSWDPPAYFSVGKGGYISSIRLTSGAVIAYGFAGQVRTR